MKDISFSYKNKPVLNQLNLDIGAKEWVVLLGPSGCGKSTLLNIIAGLYPPDGGYVMVGGEKTAGVSDVFAYMPQKDLLLPWLNILDNLCLYGKLHKIDLAEQAKQRMREFGLEGCEYLYPGQLSGGMRQRAAFLRTALCNAQILLLDEPFASLDVITREEMQDWLISLRQSWGKTTVLVTHDIDEAMLLADTVYIIDPRIHNISRSFNCTGQHKNREWLFRQADLKQQIYECIKECAAK